jgi:hypothetical protein
MKAFPAIHCTDALSGNQGSFLYQNKSENELFIAVTPIFKSVAALYGWLKDNGWRRIERYAPGRPFGTYEKD